jgi:hypothetical protein
MKTTLDLTDDLLIEAKSVAVRRRTTLKAIIEHALRREIQHPKDTPPTEDDRFETGPFGILRLKRNRGATVTAGTVRQIQDQLNQEELERALELGRRR